MSIGLGSIKKFVCHILVTPRLSHKDTFMMLYVATIIIEDLIAPETIDIYLDDVIFSNNNHEETLLTWLPKLLSSFVMVTMERPCYHGNCKDTFMTSSVAIVIIERPYYHGCYGIQSHHLFHKTYLCTDVSACSVFILIFTFISHNAPFS